MTFTPRLSLDYIQPSQSQKHVTVNEAFTKLDTAVQLSIESKTLADQPTSPAPGDIYILPDNPTGTEWGQMSSGDIVAFQNDSWQKLSPKPGWLGFLLDQEQIIIFQNDEWVGFTLSSQPQFGVNAEPDNINKFVVKSDAELLSHDDVTPGTGHARKIINRASSSETASVVFQTNYTANAEIGLTGNDNLTLKVSNDGITFLDAITIDSENGLIGCGGEATSKLTVYGQAKPNDDTGDIHIKTEQPYGMFFIDTYSSASNYNSSFSVQRRARGTLAQPSTVQLDDWCGGFSFRAYSPNGDWTQAALITAVVDTAPSGSATPMSLIFNTGQSGATEHMRITSDGKVGIGTSSPVTELDINGVAKVRQYSTASIPSAQTVGTGAIAYASGTLVFSNGTDWIRADNGNILS